MKNSTKGLLFQLPAMILLVLIVVGSFYAKMKALYPMGWETPITILVIVGLFFIGLYFQRKTDNIW